MTPDSLRDAPLFERIYALVRQIPPGKVTTYGRIARMVGGCSAQMVGFAMAALQAESDVPWQRVINRQGRISPRGGGIDSTRQRHILEAEGVIFNSDDRVDLDEFGWPGPDWAWLEVNGFFPG
jgi:methylated-DNA-protein-cysteine methyltransferase-like protein